MLRAYYDAAGSEDDGGGALTVVGLLSTEKKWLRFEQDWNRVLRDFGVPYFHMKEFAPSTGPFEKWKDDPHRRADFLLKLIAVTKRRTNKTFVSVVELAGYNEANLEYRLKESFGGAYGLACYTCLRQVDTFLERRYPHNMVLHIPEKGDRGQGPFLMLIGKEQTRGEVTPKRKGESVTGLPVSPFQACDFIAWEVRRNVIDNLGDRATEVRRSLAEIVRQLPGTERHARWTCDRIVNLCRQSEGEIPARRPHTVS